MPKSLVASIKRIAESRRVKPNVPPRPWPKATKEQLACMRKHSSTISYELAKMGGGTATMCQMCASLPSRPSRASARASRSRKTRSDLGRRTRKTRRRK